MHPSEVVLRPAVPSEATTISELARRSKAHWGYSDAFMAACHAELTMAPDHCDGVHVFVADHGGDLAGFYRLDGHAPTGELADLFVNPPWIGHGLGRHLLQHALEQAHRLDLLRLTIDADPYAEGFYRRAGALRVGTSPSGSVPGRLVPRLVLPVPRPRARQQRP